LDIKYPPNKKLRTFSQSFSLRGRNPIEALPKFESLLRVMIQGWAQESVKSLNSTVPFPR
jgi:hypothetical protein